MLVGEAVADVLVEVSAFGFGDEELLVAVGRDLEVQVTLSAAELDFQAGRNRMVADPRQSSGFQRHTRHQALCKTIVAK